MSDTPADTDTMPIEDYLAQGGVLTSPANVPPRYRGELLRLMASFVDSELAASAGFALVATGGWAQPLAAPFAPPPASFSPGTNIAETRPFVPGSMFARPESMS